MRGRVARLAALYLLLGMVTTWAVAWGTLRLGYLPGSSPIMRTHGVTGVARSAGVRYDGPGIDVVVSRHRGSGSVEVTSGAPLRSLRLERVSILSFDSRLTPMDHSRYDVIGGLSGGSVRPIWTGLALNTAFYALLWWLAIASPRMIRHNRRYRRYRRGLCPVCRYDLRADYSRGCSECGWKR